MGQPQHAVVILEAESLLKGTEAFWRLEVVVIRPATQPLPVGDKRVLGRRHIRLDALHRRRKFG